MTYIPSFLTSLTSQGSLMAQMGKDYSITSAAYGKAYNTGNQSLIAQVTDRIISSNVKNVSLVFHNGNMTPLFDGKTSEERTDWLTNMFADL